MTVEWLTSVLGVLGVAFVAGGTLSKLQSTRAREQDWKYIVLERQRAGLSNPAKAACFHPHPVAVESVVPGVGVVAWWCPSCDVHGPDRESLGWTPAPPRPPAGPGAVVTESAGGFSVTRRREERDRAILYAAARQRADEHQAQTGCEATVIRNQRGDVLRCVCTCGDDLADSLASDVEQLTGYVRRLREPQ